jgi:pimeloyl-ACP methyl ester carboxylesterase
MGGAASMDWWEDELCERLAAGPRYVIRYDHRDTGQSVSYEPGADAYSLSDLVEDAVGLLDALDVPKAHLVAMSMGAMIARLVALDHPDRVTALTMISTSGPGPGLPPMTEELSVEFEETVEPDWSDRDEVVDFLTNFSRLLACPPFDEERERELWERVLDRTASIESSIRNHAGLSEPPGWRDRLSELHVPTLVVHGTDDPLYPYGHGVALAREIRGARLLTMERTGHELPRRVWDDVVPAILELDS